MVCILISSAKSYTSVEIQGRNTFEYWIGGATDNLRVLHRHRKGVSLISKEFSSTVPNFNLTCAWFPLEIKTHLPSRKYPTSSEVPQNHNMALHGMIYDMACYSMAWYGIVYGMVRMLWYDMLWYVWYSTVQYGVAWHGGEPCTVIK